MQLSTLCVLLFVAAVIKTGESVRCYLCVGIDSTSACMDPFIAAANISTCTGEVCFKSVVKTHKVVVTRSCFGSVGKTGCDRTSAGGTSTEICMCTSNLCNGASFQRVTGTSMFTLVVFAALIARWH